MLNSILEQAQWILDEFDAQRFWSNVRFHGGTPYEDDPLVNRDRVQGECWLWGKGDDLSVYGRFEYYGAWHQAHRVAYKDFGNKLPDDLEIDHLCRVHRCVRPSHLEPVTKSVNMRRGARAVSNRTHCDHGHEFTPDNINSTDDRTTAVMACKTCLAESKRRTYLKRKSQGKA